MSDSPIYLNIVLENEIFVIGIDAYESIFKIYHRAMQTSNTVRKSLKKYGYHEIKYMRLREPVEITGNVEETLKKCHNKANWVQMLHISVIKEYFSSPKRSCVYVVLVLPQGDTQSHILRNFETLDTKLFNALKVKVKHPQKYSIKDITANGGVFCEHSPDTLERLVKRLKSPLKYTNNPATERGQFFKEALERDLGSQFHKYFTQEPEVPDSGAYFVKSYDEFEYFWGVGTFVRELKTKGLAQIAGCAELKAIMFNAHFTIPPSLTHEDRYEVDYHQCKSWDFTIYLAVDEQICKYQPRSNFSFTPKSESILFMAGEVNSNPNETKKWKVLLEAIVLARLGRFVLEANSENPFVVMAVYVTDAFVAERYLVYQNPEDPQKVNIVTKEFDLTSEDGGRDFLLEMYNFGEEMKNLQHEFDYSKIRLMEQMTTLGCELISATSLAKSMADDIRRQDVKKQRQAFDTWVDPFENREVAAFLEDELECDDPPFILLGNPNVAHVKPREEDEVCMIKVVPQEEDELEIAKYISEHRSPRNHTLRPVTVYYVSDYGLMLIPNGGLVLSSYQFVELELFSLGLQLFEGVAFLHEMGVAHLDLKDSNILVHRGQLSIIDFSLAIRVKEEGDDVILSGFRGTRGWTAPEIGEGDFDPFLADVWACGNVIRRKCLKYPRAKGCDFLFSICNELMNDEPRKRPNMQSVVERLKAASEDFN